MKDVTAILWIKRLMVTMFFFGYSGLLLGCYSGRWQEYDETMKSQIGSKNKDYYIAEWGNPSKRTRSQEGEDVWIWESSGYGGAQGWRKTLVFSSDGVLKDFRRDYWPKEVW